MAAAEMWQRNSAKPERNKCYIWRNEEEKTSEENMKKISKR
jgi:hypothetical protein